MEPFSTTGKRRGSNAAPVIDTLKSYSAFSFLQHPSWWSEAERLGLVFRQTKKERHRVALAVHLHGVYERLTGRSEQ
jgi:hypothetical protein